MAGDSLVIGIDIGGTKIAGAIVDIVEGSIRGRVELPTRPQRGGEPVLEDVVAMASRLAVEMGAPRGAARLGLAVCELVDPSGAITSAQTLAWTGAEVVASLSGIGPATIASDVRAGASAEGRFGAGRGLDPFMYVSVGTGVSSTLVVGGTPYAGRHGNALVAASGTFSTVCPRCGSEIDVVPEDIASGLGMLRRMRALDPAGVFERAEDVLALAEAGDENARAIVDEGGRMLGTIVAGLINVTDPEAVVIDGGLGLSRGRYRERFEASFAEHIWAPTSRGTPVRDASLGGDAVLIGAALAAANQGVIGGDR